MPSVIIHMQLQNIHSFGPLNLGHAIRKIKVSFIVYMWLAMKILLLYGFIHIVKYGIISYISVIKKN